MRHLIDIGDNQKLMQNNGYGKIADINTDVRYVQYGNGFCFDFIKEDAGQITITPENDYIKGKTIDDKTIYIYGRKPFKIYKGVCHYNTDIYIIGREIKDQDCIGLRFKGGILGRLFMPGKLEIDKGGERYEVNYVDDSMEYEIFANDKKFILHIESEVEEKKGVSGVSLNNTEVVLEVTTEDGLKMNELVPLYNSVLRLCQFMTFRVNICFDEIQILGYELIGDKTIQRDISDLYVQNQYRSMTEKRWIQCIEFGDLGETIKPLFKAIYEEKDKKPFFSLDFLPEDADVNWITPDKIKKICTALECEAALHKVTPQKNPEFKKLINEIASIIKESESRNMLPTKTYDVIRNSMQHWDFAASDKIKELYKKYQEILIQPACFSYSIAGFEDAIDKIIKFRNTTTHGNYMRITGELADVAANLMNLIYISRMDRIGMPQDIIKDKICSGLVY